MSCEKEEIDNTQAQLTKHEWEQKLDLIDGIPSGQKQFYKISFNQDNTCEIVLDYGGVSEATDPVTLDTLRGKYSIDLAAKVISFPVPMDTIYVGEAMTPTYVYIRSWKIVSLTNEALVTTPLENEPSPTGSYVQVGVQPYTFQPIK